MVRDAVSLAPSVWRIPTAPVDFTNSYALRADDGSVTLIDAGTRTAPRRILATLSKLEVAPRDVRRIVVTHAHPDHAGGLAKLVEQTGASVSAHEREAIYLRDGRVPNRDPSARGGNLMARFGSRGMTGVAEVDEFLDDAVLDVAGGLRVVHTPGHTPGHVALLHESTGVLFAGDAVFNVRGLRWPPSAFCTDVAAHRRSADVLGELDYEIAAFNHGAEIRDKPREAVRAFLRGRVR